MNKKDFKAIGKIAGAIPEMMHLSRNMFEAVICSTLDMYAITHELERDDVLAGVGATFMTAEIEEDDDDKE